VNGVILWVVGILIVIEAAALQAPPAVAAPAGSPVAIIGLGE